jgi:DNA-directed RNA polymerase I subunit RPA2
VVYYQRLRHMVKDKAQVRSTGPTNALTNQPVKGRKKGGGIRFGEMERDSLLAHGAAFLLHDRLHSSSDRHIALVCGGCGSVIAPHSVPASQVTMRAEGVFPSGKSIGPVTEVTRTKRVPVCKACGTGAQVRAVPMPYVFRYLANELAAMGVRIVLELGEGLYATRQGQGMAGAGTLTLPGVREKEEASRQ